MTGFAVWAARKGVCRLLLSFSPKRWTEKILRHGNNLCYQFPPRYFSKSDSISSFILWVISDLKALLSVTYKQILMLILLILHVL